MTQRDNPSIGRRLAAGWAPLLAAWCMDAAAVESRQPVQAGFEPPAHAVSVLASLDRKTGTRPRSGVILADDGNYYGVAAGRNQGDSTIYRTTPAGVATALHRFDASSWAVAALMQGPDRALYGVAENIDTEGGIIFRMSLAGEFTTLHVLTHGDGMPQTPLVLARDGNLVGITRGRLDGGNNRGELFEISTTGDFSIIARLSPRMPNEPLGQPLVGDDGAFYLTALSGGAANAGGLLRVSAKGDISTLYEFTGGSDGSAPFGPLVYDAAHQGMFGVTEAGLVFEYRGGSVTTIGQLKGQQPGQLTLGPDGVHFYAPDGPNIYSVAPGGRTKAIARLPGKTSFGNLRLIFNGAGSMIGTTYDGGAANEGTVAEIDGF